MLPSKAVRTYPHIDGFIFQSDVFCLIRLHTPFKHHMARCLLRHPGCARTRTRNAHRAADHDAPSTLPLLLPSQRGGLRAPKAEAANQKRPDEQPKTNTPMRGMTGIASWDSHLGRGFLLCPHYPPAFWHARRPISRPNDVYTDLPVPNAMRKFHAERLVKGKSTCGQVMCLAQMETKADDQGQKALQAWVRSLYGAPIWPSITSRYTEPCSSLNSTL